jgi:DMSO/TMAO reductase YedYZ heme-binding membrane subunit
MAWGVVGLYLLAAVEISSLLRRHLSKATWRRIHFLSFPLFVSATAHGITAGTELGTKYGIIAAAVVIAAVGALTAMRVVDEAEQPRNPDGTPRPVRAPRPAAAPMPAPRRAGTPF